MPFSITLVHKNSWEIFELDKSLCKYSNTFVISIFLHYEKLKDNTSFLFVVYPRKWTNVLHSRYFRGRYTLSLSSWNDYFPLVFFLFFFFIYIPTGDEGRRLDRKWDTRNKVHEELIPFRRKYGLINVELILKKKKVRKNSSVMQNIQSPVRGWFFSFSWMWKELLLYRHLIQCLLLEKM